MQGIVLILGVLVMLGFVANIHSGLRLIGRPEPALSRLFVWGAIFYMTASVLCVAYFFVSWIPTTGRCLGMTDCMAAATMVEIVENRWMFGGSAVGTAVAAPICVYMAKRAGFFR